MRFGMQRHLSPPEEEAEAEEALGGALSSSLSGESATESNPQHGFHADKSGFLPGLVFAWALSYLMLCHLQSELKALAC